MLVVAEFMTPAPYSVQRHHSLVVAEKMMREKKIRHLPVIHQQQVVGVLSERHVKEMVLRPDADRLQVDSVMTPNPYVVSPTAPLHEVAATMAERRLGSALVVDGGRLRGIFTTVDALRALAQLSAGV